MTDLTLDQMVQILGNKRVTLLSIEERFKDVLEVWVKVDGREYVQILKDVSLESFKSSLRKSLDDIKYLYSQGLV